MTRTSTEVIREKTFRPTERLVTEAVDKEEKTVYENYYDFSSEGISKIPNHRVLAINRGEKEKKLKVKVRIDRYGHTDSSKRQDNPPRRQAIDLL